MEDLNTKEHNTLHYHLQLIENLIDEKDAINEQLKDAFKDAKNDKFKIGAIKKILKIKKDGKDQYMEEEATVSEYLDILDI